MSIYLEQYNSIIDEDQSAYCRQLEMKVHYLTAMLLQAGLLKDADGRALTSLPTDITNDADVVQSTILQ